MLPFQRFTYRGSSAWQVPRSIVVGYSTREQRRIILHGEESSRWSKKMDALAWLWWILVTILGFVWSLVWFLISGWVSTLLQIAILVGAIFVLKYGWRQAPIELWQRMRSLGGFSWNWLRARNPTGVPPVAVEVREVVRVIRIKEFGDVNLSTLLSLLTVGGLLLIPFL